MFRLMSSSVLITASFCIAISALAVERRASDPALFETAMGLTFGDRLVIGGLDLDGTEVAFELERFRVLTEDAKIVVHGDDGIRQESFRDAAFFRGSIVGHERSTVVAIVRGLSITGFVVEGTDFRFLETGAAQGLKISPISRAEGEGFSCDNDQLPAIDERFAPVDVPAGASRVVGKGAAAYTARLAIETDYEFFQVFGSTIAASDYVADLVAYASTIYTAEISTDLQTSVLHLWETSTDPWTQSSPTCALYELGRYWNLNYTAEVRTLTHFLSGKSVSGGVAWVGVLCRSSFSTSHGGACPALTPTVDSYGGAYGFTGGIDGSFDISNPGAVWDIVAFTHELGHNFNSPHTHCYAGLEGNASPIDECYSGESGCYFGASTLPCGTPAAGCGTLMSYCHLLSGSFANIALTLGTGHPQGVEPDRVPQRMSSHVATSAANFPGCLDLIVPIELQFFGID